MSPVRFVILALGALLLIPVPGGAQTPDPPSGSPPPLPPRPAGVAPT